MTAERHEGPTPAGGVRSVAVYVDLATLEERDKTEADGLVISELDADERFIAETVAELRRDR